MSKLLESVLDSVKPLLSLSGGGSGVAASLSPVATHTSSLLLQLALLIGLTV